MSDQNPTPASILDGILMTDAGVTLSLRDVQDALVSAFSQTGDAKFADLANQLSELTGWVLGPYGDWEPK